jgi:hypothetical protein
MQQMITDMVKMDYVDSDGIQRRVELPAGVSNYAEGVPVSLDVDRLFMDCSPDFRRKLVQELWARNLIEPCDFMKAGAPELIRSAVQACIKIDTLDIITLANRECRRV